MASLDTLDIIVEVMEENDVHPGDIPSDDAINIDDNHDLETIRSSERYFLAKGFARFNNHEQPSRCSRTWASAHSWCVVDLKMQRIGRRLSQKCQKCEGSALPEYDNEVLKRMAGYAVRSYLRLTGRLERDPLGDWSDVSDAIDSNQPHDEERCEMCKILGRSCWN